MLALGYGVLDLPLVGWGLLSSGVGPTLQLGAGMGPPNQLAPTLVATVLPTNKKYKNTLHTAVSSPFHCWVGLASRVHILLRWTCGMLLG